MSPSQIRHLGMVFLVPTVVGGALPPEFAVPAAYGDLLAALLALLAIVALRARWPIALALVWLFSAVGTLDLLNASSRAIDSRYSSEPRTTFRRSPSRRCSSPTS
jgi:hypothetical protein